MSAVELLRRNDPERTFFRIELREETSDADLAQALEGNPFVTDLVLDLSFGERGGDWNSLLRVLATRVKLETVKLRDAPVAAVALVGPFLQAIQQNPAIRSVDLQWARLPTDISTFVDNASSITSFTLHSCDMEAAEREQGARSLAVALQRNTNIQTLELNRLDDIFTTTIFSSLRSNDSLKTLIFGSLRVSDVALHATHQLLESTTSIQRFEFEHTDFLKERLFHPIAQAITSSECVSELRFWHCTVGNGNTSALFQSILRNKRNLTSLCLQRCYFPDTEAIFGAIISTLSQPDSLLRCFQFQSLYEGEFPEIRFKNLRRVIAKSKLERFQIGYIRTPQQLQTLTEIIPSMKLKELEVHFRENEGSE